MHNDDIPFRFYSRKPEPPRESFMDAVIIPASIAIAKSCLLIALVAILIAVARHG